MSSTQHNMYQTSNCICMHKKLLSFVSFSYYIVYSNRIQASAQQIKRKPNLRI